MAVPYIVNHQRYIGLYDKKEKKTYTYNRKYFQEQLKVGDAFTYIAGRVNDCCVVPLDISNLIDLKKDDSPLPEGLSKLVEESTADDNPVLMLMEWKEKK